MFKKPTSNNNAFETVCIQILSLDRWKLKMFITKILFLPNVFRKTIFTSLVKVKWMNAENHGSNNLMTLSLKLFNNWTHCCWKSCKVW